MYGNTARHSRGFFFFQGIFGMMYMVNTDIETFWLPPAALKDLSARTTVCHRAMAFERKPYLFFVALSMEAAASAAA